LTISGVGSQVLATPMAALECDVSPIAILGLGLDVAISELAREYGAHHTIHIEQVDPLEAVPDLLGGKPDVVV